MKTKEELAAANRERQQRFRDSKKALRVTTVTDVTQKRNAPKPKTPGPSVWKEWIDLHRELNRHDPIAVGPDLGAAKVIGERIPEADKRVSVLRAYLLHADKWLIDKGHGLRYLLANVNRYLNPDVKSADEMTQDEITQRWLDQEHARARQAGYGMAQP